VLALGIKLGCGTNDLSQYVSHLIVYWVGPCIAALLARPIYNRLVGIQAVAVEKEKKEE